jgi:hypothetical protein
MSCRGTIFKPTPCVTYVARSVPATVKKGLIHCARISALSTVTRDISVQRRTNDGLCIKIPRVLRRPFCCLFFFLNERQYELLFREDAYFSHHTLQRNLVDGDSRTSLQRRTHTFSQTMKITESSHRIGSRVEQQISLAYSTNEGPLASRK